MNTLLLTKKKTPIKKTITGYIFSASLITSLAATPVMAYEQSQHDYFNAQQKQQAKNKENIAFGTGALIGAVVAGPFGAVFTGLVGSLWAKHSNTVDQREQLSAALAQEKNHHQVALEKYQKTLQQAEQAYQGELLALQQSQQRKLTLQAENLLMSLQFTTGSSDLPPHYHQQITALAQSLSQSKNISIDLSGYTDLQGGEQRNEQLSLARVQSVKQALIAEGISAERIHLYAFGEKQPVLASAEQPVNFYDRRVDIKLRPHTQQIVKN
jgi:sortase system peptidoglycan-associated protein